MRPYQGLEPFPGHEEGMAQPASVIKEAVGASFMRPYQGLEPFPGHEEGMAHPVSVTDA